MSHILFEQLENAGYIRGTNLNHSAIERALPVDILDLAQESCELTSAKDLPQDNALLSHSASIALGCGRWPCSGLNCRRERAEQLAHFAALYSDRVYIRNLFSDYVEHLDDRHLPDESVLRERFAEDLEILTYLRPFIEAEKILPITAPNYCLHCLAKHSGLQGERQLTKSLRSLVQRMEDEIDASLSYSAEGLYHIHAKGPEDLLAHGSSHWLGNTAPPNLDTMPRIYERIQKGKTVHLSRWALRKIGYPAYLASFHRRSIIFELSLAQCLGTGFLTDMSLHVQFLKELSSGSPWVERDALVERHLTCLVPFLKELSPAEVLQVREKEEDAFILFKSALAEAIGEYRKNYGRFEEADARALYSDILRPKLAELDTIVDKARRTLIKGTVRKVLAWTGAISFGVYTGFLPQGLAAAAGALGLTKILADFTEGLMAKSDTEESARGHNMYFLWKIKKMVH